MPLSARNHLPGVIEEIQRDTILAHVVIRVGDHIVESVITRRSADELGLKVGDRITAVVKATEVMVSKP
jgi:molybdopterin-binding protein